jgi:uncharacterized protein YecE (DUF72 family)
LVLGGKLGPVLFQLPPHWKPNPGRLSDFLKPLPQEHDYAFEFRDPGWFIDEVYAVLRDAGAAFCIYHLAGWAGAFSVWSRQGKEIYCYFDNDQTGYAAQDALRLQAVVQGTVRCRPKEMLREAG